MAGAWLWLGWLRLAQAQLWRRDRGRCDRRRPARARNGCHHELLLRLWLWIWLRVPVVRLHLLSVLLFLPVLQLRLQPELLLLRILLRLLPELLREQLLALRRAGA